MAKKTLINILFIFSIGFPMRVFSQEITPDDSFTFDLCLPNSVSNKPYQMIMQGLVHASTHYQYAFKSGYYVGAGLHYSYFAINEFRVQPKVYGGIHSGSVFLKTGHEKFWSERFGTDIGVRSGWVRSYIVSDALAQQGNVPLVKEGLYLEPNISFILTADVNQSFRLTIGYPIYLRVICCKIRKYVLSLVLKTE